MQKLKNSIVNRMLEEHLTGAEINLLLHISKYQEDQGRVCGVYYKDVCAAIGISYETFYTSLETLEKKGFIKRSRGAYGDSDIVILDNDCSCGEEWEKGYINTGNPLFYNPEFYRLKAGEKLLALQFFKNAGAGHYHIGINKLYHDFSEKLGVKRRTIQQYLRRLKEYFSITLKDGILHVRYKEKYESERRKNLSSNEEFVLHVMRVAFRRSRIHMPAPYQTMNQLIRTSEYKPLNLPKDLTDVKNLFRQYWPRHGTGLAAIFLRAVQRSLEKINDKQPNQYRWKREINPKLIHKCIIAELG